MVTLLEFLSPRRIRASVTSIEAWIRDITYACSVDNFRDNTTARNHVPRENIVFQAEAASKTQAALLAAVPGIQGAIPPHQIAALQH
jgi:hypothetical protein